MKKVLIVDDNHDICAILRKRLEDNGFSVDTKEDGYSLLGYLQDAQPPDAVILDLMLPGKNGVDLLYSLKCKWPETRLFVFSAHSEYKNEPSFQDYICGFFCKSEGIDKLIEAVEKEL